MVTRTFRWSIAAAAMAALLSACSDSVVQPDGNTLSGADSRVARVEEVDGGGGGEEDPFTGGGYGGGGGADGGGVGTGGSVPPFSPPPPANQNVWVPISNDGVTGESYSCLQRPSARVAFSNDVVRGTYLYGTGVVPKGTKITFQFYNEAGQLVKTHVTNYSRDNCVVHHEHEAISTADMAPGYYYVYAAFWTLAYRQGEVWHGYAWHGGTVNLGPMRIRAS